ncbi:MAG: hypothetical protein ACI4UE_05110 [Candidatus Scatovivens sp.]
MANEQNLIPLNKRSQRERKEITTKGANASNKVQKEKKLLKQQFEMLMSLEIMDDKLKEQLLCLGIPQNETTLQMALCVAITKQALQGNIKAFELIRDTLGQNPSDVIENEEKATIIFINDIKDLPLENGNS